MNDSTTPRRQFPYYGSYAGFYRALRELKERGVPRRVETRFFGANLKNEATRVVAGFSSLGWTNEAGQPNDDLVRIVKSFATDAWRETLADVVPRAYPYLSSLDLETASKSDLRETFVSYVGRDAEAMRNAETFFLCLSYEAGRPMSEEFIRRAERGAGDARKWLKLAESGVLDDIDTKDDETDVVESGAQRVAPIVTHTDLSAADKLIELHSWFSTDMTQQEKDAIHVLAAYFARKHKQNN